MVPLTVKHPFGTPVSALDTEDWQAMMRAARDWLDLNHSAVNALNVYPVPDGDTGTNMLLTMRDACDEMTAAQDGSVGALMQALAHGALMGARGNSGVILSQILRGVARSVHGRSVMTVAEFAAALQEGSNTAYRGVQKPVEGTILTVVREAASVARRAASTSADMRFVLGQTVQAAADAVERTPTLLDVLAQAGVVDAGGKGLYYILEGWLRYLRGESVQGERVTSGAFAGRSEALTGEYGYDVQFVVQGEDLNVEEIRQTISGMGDSALVVGDEYTVKVHVHSKEPGTPLNYGASLGRLGHIVLENMQEQYEDFVRGRDTRESPAVSDRPPATLVPTMGSAIGIVAVVPGAGLQEVTRSLGASAVVPGGQTMNPSTQDILKAIESVTTDQVIVLPNNGNVILTARQAQQLSHKQVRIVPSKTIPQGIAALLAFAPQSDLDSNAKNMEEALGNIQTGEVTVAVRAALFNGFKVAPGDVIGLLNDQLTATGSTNAEVVTKLLGQMKAREMEVITIYRGKDVTLPEAEVLTEVVRAAYPDQQVELISGEQPHYRYILSAE